MKLIDVDGLFDEYLNDFIENNADSLTEKDLAEKMEGLLEEFNRIPISQLGDKTPIEYFKGFSSVELINLLEEYVRGGISVPQALCEEIVFSGDEDELAKLIDLNDAELTAYCVNLLNDKRSAKAYDKYVNYILDKNVDEDLKGLFTESLMDAGDDVKELVLQNYGKEKFADDYFIEILVGCSKDQRISNILTEAFLAEELDLSVLCAYLTRYGDKDLIRLLYDKIESEDIEYKQFKELKSAIESLGGSYTKPRDFVSKAVLSGNKTVKYH